MACLLGALFIYYAALRKIFGEPAAFFGTWVALVGIFLLTATPGIERTVLVFQFAAPYFFVRWMLERNHWIWGLGIGELGAFAFLLRANCAGVHVVIALFVLGDAIRARDWRALLGRTAALGLGAFAPLAFVTIFLCGKICSAI